MAAAAPTFTVIDVMAQCGVDNFVLFNGATQAQRFGTEVFDNDFHSCMDKTFEELDEDFKSYSTLTVANCQIRLNPGTKRNIRAFIQWTRDLLRVGEDPTLVIFPVNDALLYIRRFKTHANFCQKAKTISEIAKPGKLKDTTKWEEWAPVFLNFLKALPGRHGHPLQYICQPNDQPTLVQGVDILDDYVNRAPLYGEAYEIDAAEVHTYIVNFIAGK